MAPKTFLTNEELQKWVIDKAAEVNDPYRSRKLLLSNDMRARPTTIVGRMFFFKYDPIGKNYLPKYDKFPLVIVLDRQGHNFFGLNLHYLDPGARFALVDMLREFENNDKRDPTTKLLVNYNIIESVSRIASLAKPCYKRYLFQQCRSKFIEIYADEYETAMQIPVENWHFKP